MALSSCPMCYEKVTEMLVLHVLDSQRRAHAVCESCFDRLKARLPVSCGICAMNVNTYSGHYGDRVKVGSRPTLRCATVLKENTTYTFCRYGVQDNISSSIYCEYCDQAVSPEHPIFVSDSPPPEHGSMNNPIVLP